MRKGVLHVKPKTLLGYFWQYVNLCATTACWNWTGAIMPRGYGHLTIPGYLSAERREVLAHRLAWELFRGLIPTGMTIDHLCRNRICVNVDHLECVTLKENVRRGVGHTGVNARKTFCIHGHQFTETNTVRRHDIRRECRECKNTMERERRARRSAA